MWVHVISMPQKKKLQGAQILDLEATIKIGLEGSILSDIIPNNDKITDVNKDHQKISSQMKYE